MNDRKKFLDSEERPLTQSLFLELGYNECAIYTLKEYDYEYKGKVYPSIKRLYLEANDPTEYSFAIEYFLNWKHWMRICENKQIRKHIDEWREELEIKVRADAYKQMLTSAKTGTVAASRWLADRGWDVKKVGRPKKEDIEKEKKIMAQIENEYEQDGIRLIK